MNNRQEARTGGEWETEKKFNKEIKKAVRQDKKRAKLDKLEEADQWGYKWDELKRMRKNFVAKKPFTQNHFSKTIILAR